MNNAGAPRSRQEFRKCAFSSLIRAQRGNQRLAVLCTYPLAACGAPQILDVVRTHQFVLARRHGKWDVLETATLKRAKAELKGHNEELERRVVERTSDLMKASEALREAQAELARAIAQIKLIERLRKK